MPIVIEEGTREAAMVLDRKAHNDGDLAFLTQSAIALLQLGPDEDVYKFIAKKLIAVIGGEPVVVVFSFDENSSCLLRCMVGHDTNCSQGDDTLMGLLSEISPLAKEAMRTGQLTRLPEGMHDLVESQERQEQAAGLMEKRGSEMIHVVGVVHFGHLISGIVIVQGNGEDPPRTAILDAFIGQATVGLVRQRAQEAALLKSRELEMLYAIANATGHQLSTQGRVEAALDEMNAVTGRPVGLWLLDEREIKEPPGRRRCRLACSRGHAPELDAGQYKEVMLSLLLPDLGQPDKIQISKEFKHCPTDILPRLRNLGIESCLIVPLGSGEDVPGYLCLCGVSESSELVHSEKFLETLGHQLGLSLRNARLYEKADDYRNRLGDVAAQLTAMEEKERRRLARDVHDDVGQPLGLARMLLTAAIGELSSDVVGAKKRLEDAASLLGRANTALRAITLDLHPPILDNFGIGSAIESAAIDFEKTTGLIVEHQIDYREMLESSEIRAYLLRAAKELLVNAAKHAKAKRVMVELFKMNSCLHLGVMDDGLGLDTTQVFGDKAAPKGIGLLALSERVRSLGGSFNVDTAARQGTRIEIIVPIEPPASDSMAD